jgi:uncharacterized protein DUF4388
MRSAFEGSGDIRSVDLLSALVALWREGAGGSLKFSRAGATAGFDLSAGELVAAHSSQPQFDTAAILMRSAKLDPAALDRLQKLETEDRAFAAMQEGLINLREFRWGQKMRAIEILSDLLDWLEGDYVFEAGDRPAPSDWTLPVPRLVLELFLRSRDRTLVEHYLGPSDLPLVRAEDFDREFETFGLTSDAGSVVRLIDGQASAEEIAETAPADEFAVLKLLAALTTLGLVHPVEAALPEDEEEEPVAAETGPVVAPAASAETVPRSVAEAIQPEEAGKHAVSSREAPEFPVEPAGQPVAEAEPEPEAEAATRALEQPAQPRETPAFEPARLPSDLIPEAFEPPIEAESAGEELEHPPAAAPDITLGAEGKRSSGVLLGSLLAVLVLAVLALLIVRSRGGPRPRPSGPVPQATAQENPVFPPPETAVPLGARKRVSARSTPLSPPAAAAATRTATPPPAATSTRAAPTSSPTRVPTRPEPSKSPTKLPTRPEPTRPPAVRPTPQPPVPAAGALSRDDWLRRAEQHRQSLSKQPGVRYAIQLELACEVPTVERAWNWDRPSRTMWVLATPYRGRTCFRVLWGRFRSLEEAKAAKVRVPAFFTDGRNRPVVVSVR